MGFWVNELSRNVTRSLKVLQKYKYFNFRVRRLFNSFVLAMGIWKMLFL